MSHLVDVPFIFSSNLIKFRHVQIKEKAIIKSLAGVKDL